MSPTPDHIGTGDLAERLPASVSLSAVTFEDEEAIQWRDWLSQEERACIEGFGAASRRREFLAGRAAARQLLARELGVPPRDVPLRRADDDAVDVDAGNWFVSIAHSGPHAIAACSQHRIGVDLEHIQPRDKGLVRFLFPPDEHGVVDTLPYTGDASIILCWTLKEAVLKGRRTGFRTSPKGIHLTVNPEVETAHAAVDDGMEWDLVYTERRGYWMAVAVPSSVTHPSGA